MEASAVLGHPGQMAQDIDSLVPTADYADNTARS